VTESAGWWERCSGAGAKGLGVGDLGQTISAVDQLSGHCPHVCCSVRARNRSRRGVRSSRSSASGGHTEILRGMRRTWRRSSSGARRADDCGGRGVRQSSEALGLGLYGRPGPAIDKLAANGDASRVPLVDDHGAKARGCSFSGKKTAGRGRNTSRRMGSRRSPGAAISFARSGASRRARVDEAPRRGGARECDASVVLGGARGSESRLRTRVTEMASAREDGVRAVAPELHGQRGDDRVRRRGEREGGATERGTWGASQGGLPRTTRKGTGRFAEARARRGFPRMPRHGHDQEFTEFVLPRPKRHHWPSGVVIRWSVRESTSLVGDMLRRPLGLVRGKWTSRNCSSTYPERESDDSRGKSGGADCQLRPIHHYRAWSLNYRVRRLNW